MSGHARPGVCLATVLLSPGSGGALGFLSAELRGAGGLEVGLFGEEELE